MTSQAEIRSLAVFISGSGRTLKNLYERIKEGVLPARIEIVVASRECAGEQWAASEGIPTQIIKGVIPKEELGRLLVKHHVEYVALAGYLKLFEVPGGFENRVVNIHPGLLPSFGGPGMYGGRVHRAVIESGCRVSGCTVHLCDETYDTGPIITQLTCPVHENDTPETLAERVFALEMRAYPAALRSLLLGELRVDGRRVYSDAHSGA